MRPRCGAIVPHAPLLVPGVMGDPDPEVVRIAEVVASLDFTGADIAVVVSPHGAATGIYEAIAGSLTTAGVQGFEIEHETDGAAVRDLAAAWDKPLLGGPVDHGVAVPLMLKRFEAPVIAVALQSCTGPGARPVGEARRDGLDLADALGSLLARRTVALVASAGTSAAITERAPLQRRPEADRLEEAVLQGLADPQGLARIPPELWSAAGSCGAGPLAAFGRAFDGVPVRKAHYGAPYGVGYLVAAVP